MANTFWTTNQFKQAISQLRQARETEKAVNTYATTVANIANKNQPPATPPTNQKKIFDWGASTYGANLVNRLDDRKQAQLATQELNKDYLKKSLPISDSIEQQRIKNWQRDQQIQQNVESNAQQLEQMKQSEDADVRAEAERLMEAQRFEEQIASTMKLDPTVKPGDKVYLDRETNTITNKPTELELFSFEGLYIPMIRTNSNNLVPAMGYRDIPIDLTMLKEVKHTPDLDIFLRGLQPRYMTVDPPKVSPTVKASGKQAYLDVITNEVVDYETQVPLYFDGENENNLLTQNAVGFDGEANPPVLLNEETLGKLQTELDAYWTAYEQSKLAGMLGMQADPAAVRSISSLTASSITEGVVPKIASDVNVNEQTTVIDPKTGDPIYMEKYPEPTRLMVMLSSIPVGEKTLGETKVGKALGLANMPAWGVMYGGNVTKQILNTPQSESIMEKPWVFGISPTTVMAGFGVGATALYNTVMSLTFRLPAVLTHQIAGKEIKGFQGYVDSWEHLDEVVAIAKQSALTDKLLREQKRDGATSFYNTANKSFTQASAQLWLLNNGKYAGMESMSDQQVFELRKSLEKRIAEATDEINIYEAFQGSTIGRFTELTGMSANYLKSGNPQVAQVSLSWGYELKYQGADYGLGRMYVGLPQEDKVDMLARTDISQDQKNFLAGLDGLSLAELNAFEGFVNSGMLTSVLYADGMSHYSAAQKLTGANLLFLYDAAKKSLDEGTTFTTAELYDYLVDEWIPQYFSSESAGAERYNQIFTQASLDIANTMFSQMEASNSYQAEAALLREGSPEKILAIGNSAKFKEEAYRLGRMFIEMHKRSGILNPYASWTIQQDPKKEEEFYDLVITAMLQVGRPLTMEEITNISYYIQDPALELMGEVFLDANNLVFPVVGSVAKLGAKGVVTGVKKIPYVSKLLTAIADSGLAKKLTQRSAQSVAAKHGQAAVDGLNDVLRKNVATKEEFMAQVEKVIAWVKSVREATDAVTRSAKIADNTLLGRKLINEDTTKQALLDLADDISPDDWGRYFSKAWDDTAKHYTEAYTEIVLKNNPGKTVADTIVQNQIAHLVEQSVTSPKGLARVGDNLKATIKDATLYKLTTNLGPSRVFEESFLANFAAKHGDTLAGKTIGGLMWLQNRFMSAWVWATLARRPAWMIYNFVDNMFRYTTANILQGSAFLDDMKGVGKMLTAGGVEGEVLAKQVTVPSVIKSTFRDDVTASFGKVPEVLAEAKNMSANPFSFLSHYRKFVSLNGQGKGLWGKAWGAMKAFPHSVVSLNNTIESSMRTMMWLRLYEKNIKQLNHAAIADVLGNLSEEMVKYGIPEDTGKIIQDHVMNAWASSGGNADKLHDLLKAEFSDKSISGYNIYIPENLRQAEWFNEATQRGFIFGVTREFTAFKKEMAAKGITDLTPEHLDNFFDGMIRTLAGEQQVILQALDQNYAMMRNADILGGVDQYKTARYSESAYKAIKEIDPNDKAFIDKFIDMKKPKAKEKKRIKDILDTQGIKYDDTDAGLKEGAEKLRARVQEYEDAKTAKASDVTVVETGAVSNQSSLNAKEIDIMTSRQELTEKWKARDRVEAITHEFVEDIEELKKVPGFDSLSDPEINAVSRVAKGVMSSVNNISARVTNFFDEVYPGKYTPKWADQRTQRLLYQLDNRIAFSNAEVLVPLRNGTFSPVRGIDMEEILQLSGIRPLYNESGEITSFQLYNPVTGATELIDHPAIVKSFKKYVGADTAADMRKDLVAELLEKGKKPLTADYRQRIAFSLGTPEAPTWEKMIADDPRLDLALREGRNQDAAVLIAERFQFPMSYVKDGQIRNDYHHLLNKVKKEMGLKGDASIKTLDDLKPEDVYTVLKNQFESEAGLVLNKVKGALKPAIVSTIKDLFNLPTDLAEYAHRTMEMMTETLGKNLQGKTSEEVWQEAVYAIMPGGMSDAVDVMKTADFDLVFNTAVRSSIDNWVKRGVVENGVKRNLKKHELRKLLIDKFGEARVKASGLDNLLKGKAQVSRESIIELLDKTERFITSKKVGSTYAKEISIFDMKKNNLATITADVVSDEVGDGNIVYKLNITQATGDLDEYSKQRLLSWAADQQYSEVRFLDGTVSAVTPSDAPSFMASGTYGVTSWVKAELDRQQAIIRAFQNGNLATWFEESFHALEPYLPASSAKILDDWAEPIAEEMMKKNPLSGLSKQQWISEVKAKGFQKVMVTTQRAPTAVQKIFDAMRNTLLEIFKKWKNYFDGIVIPKNVEDEFLKLLDQDYIAKKLDEVPKPKTPRNPLYQRIEGDVPYVEPFYLKSAKVVEEMIPTKASAEQVRNILQKNLKVDEYQWLGFDELLEGKKSLTREELLQHIRDNTVNIKEIYKGDWNLPVAGDIYEQVGKELDAVDREIGRLAATIQEMHPGVAHYFDLDNYLHGYGGSYEDISSWYKNILPNQRESMEALKNKYIKIQEDASARIQKGVMWGTEHESFRTIGGTNYRELLLTMPDIEPQFLHNHWKANANVLAHVRLQDFEDMNGKRVLFIEEIQSDWHQMGRKRGYGITKLSDFYDEALNDLDRFGWSFTKEIVDFDEMVKDSPAYVPRLGKQEAWVIKNKEGVIQYTGRDRQAVIENLTKDLYGGEVGQGIPDVPFKSNWEELMLKRITRLASEEGYDKVAFTTGQMQVKRYPNANMGWAYEFYDKKIPSRTKNIIKKWNSNIEMVELSNGFVVKGFDITPEMRYATLYEGQPLFQKIDNLTDPNEWRDEMLKLVDNMFYDTDTTLFKYPAKLKKHVVTVGTAEFDYIEKAFGQDVAKNYVQQLAENINGIAGGFPVAHVQPGKFVISFDSMTEVSMFRDELQKLSMNPVVVNAEGEVWSILPKYVGAINSDKNIQSSINQLTNVLQDAYDQAVSDYMSKIGFEPANLSMEEFYDLISKNEAALYPNIRKGVIEQSIDDGRPWLYVLHNVSLEKLRKIIGGGGKQVSPSLAGLSKDVSEFISYGEISLVGNKTMIDPAIDVRNRIFDADIYSPRNPNIMFDPYNNEQVIWLNGKQVLATYENQFAAMAEFQLRGGEFGAQFPAKVLGGEEHVRAFGARELKSIEEMKAAAKNIKSEKEMYDFIFKYQKPRVDKAHDAYEAWFAANISFGQPTSMNFFAILGNFGYDGKITKEAMRGWLEKVIPEGFRGKDVRIVPRRILSLDPDVVGTDTLYDVVYTSSVTGQEIKRTAANLEEAQSIANRLGSPQAKDTIPDSLVEKMMDAWKAIVIDTPTTYFEIKPQRIVDMREYTGAVVPWDTPTEIIDTLTNEYGLDVRYYGGYAGNTRQSVLESFFNEVDVLFQKIPKQDPQMQDEAWRAFVQSPIFDYGTEKVSLQDMWLAIHESEEKLYKAGAIGFSNYAARVAQQLEDSGAREMAEVFTELGELTKNFDNYINYKISRLDPLFPTDAVTGSPIPLWKTNDDMRKWISNKFMVGSQWFQQDKALKIWRDAMKKSIDSTEWGKAGMTLDAWKEAMKAQPGSLLNKTEITPEVRQVLDNVAEYASNVKNDIDQVANYGGAWKDISIEPSNGAVNKTNFVMMDYSDTSEGLHLLKQVFPFITYPAKSIGYWMDLMVTHPELIAFYYKYQHFSESVALQHGAVASNGEVLPSLKGYMPLMDGLWFNPTAPLFYRFAFPRLDTLPEEQEDLTPMQSMAKFLLDDAPVFGLNVGPIATALLRSMHDPYYPKPGLPYEALRSFVAIDWIPPIFERYLMEKLRKNFLYKGYLFEEDTMSPRVGWADYLVERQLLIDGLQKMDTMQDESDKMAIAKEIKALIGNPNRQEDDRWIEARNKVEMEQYYRTMFGHMTGLYTKPLTDGQLRLQEVRDEINVLKAMIEDQTMTNLFGVYKDPERLYEDYKNYKFETPEGYFWSAIQMTRYVVDPETGEPLYGEDRQKKIAEQYNIEEQTSMYFTAIKEAKQRYEDALADVPVGDWELRNQIKEEYQIELNSINENKDYALANQESYLGYKPDSKIYKDLLNRFWYQIIATKPSRGDNEEYETYERRVAQWEKEIPETASIALPILEMSILAQVMESGIKTEERLAQIPVWIAKIKEQANIDGMDQWNKDNATLLDASWRYYEEQVLSPYFDGLKGKNTYEAQLFKTNWQANYSEPPLPEVIDWIRKEYGDKWTDEEIEAELLGAGYVKPEDRLNAGKNDIEKSADTVWTLLAAAGPGNSQKKKDMMAEFYKLGGTDFEIDLFYHVGGDVDRYGVEEYTEFLRKLELAAYKVGIGEPTAEQLEVFVAARDMNDAFRLDVEKQLGTSIWDWMNEYYAEDEAGRKQWRADNPNEYFAISQYYTLKDMYAVDNPEWAAFYHPDFDGVGSAGGSGGSSGGNYSGYGGSYSSNSSGYSASYYDYKRSPLADAFLPIGRRGQQTGMDAVVYGLGRGGVVRTPWWPRELLEKLHPAAVQQIQSGNITQAGVDYLNSVAESNPDYSKVIRDNLKILRGYRHETQRKELPVME